MEWLTNNYEIVTAISAIVISITSLFLSIRTFNVQKNHNQLSLRPIAHLSKGDYDNEIFIKIKNYGLGPLIIENFDVEKQINPLERNSYKKLIDSFEELAGKITWDTFTDQIEGRVLAPQKEFVLIKASFTEDQSEIREKIRNSLSNTSLILDYKCLYDSKYKLSEKLEWFCR